MAETWFRWLVLLLAFQLVTAAVSAQETTTTTESTTTTATTTTATTTTATTTTATTTTATTTTTTTTTLGCTSDSACSSQNTVKYECTDGEDGDVYKVTKTYTCNTGTHQCVSSTDDEIYDSCTSDQKCIDGKSSCQDSDYCVTDADCPTTTEYYCDNDNIWRRKTTYECNSHTCETKGDPTETQYAICPVKKTCDQTAIDDGYHTTAQACTDKIPELTTISTTSLPTTSSSRTTTTTERPTTTTTGPRTATTTNTIRATTTATNPPETTTTLPPTTTTVKPPPSLLDRLIYQTPLELTIEAFKKIIDALIFWN